MVKEYKYIIVGAGLSGLVTAHKLKQRGEEDFIILESRSRIGGRVLTKDHIDFGATWLQTDHTTLLGLLDELNIEVFDQYSKGQSVLVYSSMSPAHYFEMDASQPASKRIVGGTRKLIDTLYKSVEDKVVLDTEVLGIQNQGTTILIKTTDKSYVGAKVVFTLPALLASELTFEPSLPSSLKEAMEQTHTWMSNAIKVGIHFETPFWKKKGFSGTVIGQASPVVELYDHTNFEENTFILKGFVNESLRELTIDTRRERILNFLEKYLGEEVQNYLSYEEKDWSLDTYTSGKKLNSYYLSPQYGIPIFQDLYYDSKLVFSGTETSESYGGYLEGAVRSGVNAFKLISNESDQVK